MVDLVLGIAGGRRGLDALQPRDRPAGDGRQARRPHEEHLRLALVGRPRPPRRAGCSARALSILGWPLQVVALLLAPLVVVQPALAAGLLVLLFIGERMLGEHAGPLRVHGGGARSCSA